MAKAPKAPNVRDHLLSDQGADPPAAQEPEALPLLPTHMHHATEKPVIARTAEEYREYVEAGFSTQISDVADDEKHAVAIHARGQATQTERGNSVKGQHVE
jgi:hypothetical protein